MTDQQLLERIVLNPKVLAGKPVIRGTRLSVSITLFLNKIKKIFYQLRNCT
ncbi:MAG: DUF433 domain-containing protein [Nostoc sp.]|uniref:DUF433 domain-containing protein n=1 Tax=Nostoc sp. TaxID=1180 RepID=UPI002FFA7061